MTEFNVPGSDDPMSEFDPGALHPAAGASGPPSSNEDDVTAVDDDDNESVLFGPGRTMPGFESLNREQLGRLFGQPATFLHNDEGNAQRFGYYVGREVRYCKKTRQWFNWDDRRWNPSTEADMMKVAREVTTIFMMYEQFTLQDDRREVHVKWVLSSMNKARLEAMVRLATGDPKLWRSADEFDTQPHLINFRNGTVDLRTGELTRHERSDYLTTLVNYDYDPTAQAPRWKRLVRRVLQNAAGIEDPDLVRFVHRTWGYALWGSNPEHIIVFLFGPERSGKTTVVDVPRTLLGEVGHRSEPMLISKTTKHHSSEQYSLIQRRMIGISETNSTFNLDENRVKALTGDFDATVYKVFSGVERVVPVTWTIYLATNDLPNVQLWDGAIAERVVPIPCGPTIPKEERDPHLPATIIAEEAEGVLAWLVAGCVDWHETLLAAKANPAVATTGLPRPDCVALAAEKYRDDSDHIGHFIQESLVVDPNARTARTLIAARARRWSMNNAAKVPRNKLFAAIERLEGVKLDDRSFVGVKLKVEGLDELAHEVYDG